VDGDRGPGWAREHYGRGAEEGRLETPVGRLEHARTRELVLRHLPAPPAVVADVGGGPGDYTIWLLGLGHTVRHRDLVPMHVDRTRALAWAAGLTVDAAVADARRLDLPDASVDAVLLLGPLYHLVERDSRVACLREAGRVVRPGGPVFAAAISRWSPLLQGVLVRRVGAGDPTFGEVVERLLATGVMPPLAPGGFAGYCHRPQELPGEAVDAGLEPLGVVSVEGLGSALADLETRWADPAERQVVLDVVRRAEAVPELLGLGAHLLLTARRPL
jgi:SAM-dependent methyltransferase